MRQKSKTNLLTSREVFRFDSMKLSNYEEEARDARQSVEIFIVGRFTGWFHKNGAAAPTSYQTDQRRRSRKNSELKKKASIDRVLTGRNKDQWSPYRGSFAVSSRKGAMRLISVSCTTDQIIIMADADVGRAHISAPLVLSFYRFMPELIFERFVFIHVAIPPFNIKTVRQKGKEYAAPWWPMQHKHLGKPHTGLIVL